MLAIDHVVKILVSRGVIRLDFISGRTHQRFKNGNRKSGSIHAIRAMHQIRAIMLYHIAQSLDKPFLKKRIRKSRVNRKIHHILRRIIRFSKTIVFFGISLIIRKIQKCLDASKSR